MEVVSRPFEKITFFGPDPLTVDRVYRWRLLLEKYGLEIVYIIDIHNTIADSISRLEDDPSVNQAPESYCMVKVKSSKSSQRQHWMAISKIWCKLDIDINTNKHKDLNFLFASHGEEEEVYPLTTIKIAEA